MKPPPPGQTAETGSAAEPAAPPELSGLILAGGQSRRMGRDKAWMEHDGRPLVTHALVKLEAVGAVDIFISGLPGVDYTALGRPVLRDLESGLGPLAGIERGLAAVRTPLLLVLAVDLPGMTVSLLQRLCARIASPRSAARPSARSAADRGSNGLIGVVPRVNDRLEPLAAIYPRRAHGLAAELLARRELTARGFARACLEQRFVAEMRVEPADAACFANWNAPGDLETS